jgi:hypothetical protein
MPFCRAAAPIAAFTGDPQPEVETAGTRQGRSASAGWLPDSYFVSRCKAGRDGFPVPTGGGK